MRPATPKRQNWEQLAASRSIELPDFRELAASAGAEAQAAGKPRSACPHGRRTAEAAAWLDGWTISKADLERRR